MRIADLTESRTTRYTEVELHSIGHSTDCGESIAMPSINIAYSVHVHAICIALTTPACCPVPGAIMGRVPRSQTHFPCKSFRYCMGWDRG